MSEESGETQASTTTATTETKAAPTNAVIDPAVIAKISQDAKEAALTQAREEGNRQTQKIVEALTGKSGKEPRYDTEALVDRFVSDPAAVLAATAEAASRKTRDEVLAEVREDARVQREVESAFREALKGRPDLADPEVTENLDAFLAATNPQDSIRDRMKEAVRKYDLMIEKAGGPKAEERIRKASSVKTSGGMGQAPEAEKSINERRTASFDEHQKARLEKFKAARGGRLHHA